MKQILYILALAAGLISCNSNSDKITDTESTDSSEVISTDQKQSNIYIKDTTEYSKTFIEELKTMGFSEPVQIIHNSIIIGADTTLFPEDLKINRKTVFRGSDKNGRTYELVTTRINQTTIVFSLFINNDNKTVLPIESGEASLSAVCIYGSENDEDKLTGDSYGCYEYWKKENDCWCSVRIGIGKNKNGKQRAKVAYLCDDRELSLDDCPTLLTE